MNTYIVKKAGTKELVGVFHARSKESLMKDLRKDPSKRGNSPASGEFVGMSIADIEEEEVSVKDCGPLTEEEMSNMQYHDLEETAALGEEA